MVADAIARYGAGGAERNPLGRNRKLVECKDFAAPLRRRPAHHARLRHLPRAETAQIAIDQRLGVALELHVAAVREPVADQPVDHRVEADRGELRDRGLRKEAALDRVADRLLGALDAAAAGCGSCAPSRPAMSSRYSHLCVTMSNTRWHCGSVAVRFSASTAAFLSSASGSSLSSSIAARDHLLDRQRNAIHHRGEKLALVPEVPVDRAARDAGGFRDVLERRVRHAALREHRAPPRPVCRCGSQPLRPAFFLPFNALLARVNRTETLLRRLLLYIHTCLYVNCAPS